MDPTPPTSPLLGPPCPASQWALGAWVSLLENGALGEVSPAPTFDSIMIFTPESHSAQSTVVALNKIFYPRRLHSSRGGNSNKQKTRKKQVLKSADSDELPAKGKQGVQERPLVLWGLVLRR